MELYKEKGSHKRKKGLLEENNWDKGRYPNTRYSGEKKGRGEAKKILFHTKVHFFVCKAYSKVYSAKGGGGREGMF